MSAEPSHLNARVGEYRPPGCRDVRITAGGCVMENDMLLLACAQRVQRDVYVAWDDTIKTKEFTRLMLGDKTYLADRVTGTLYNESSGLSSSPSLRLV